MTKLWPILFVIIIVLGLMGQIASIFDPNERRRDEELEYIDEEDEYVNSMTQTPYEEEDDDDESIFKDCVRISVDMSLLGRRRDGRGG